VNSSPIETGIVDWKTSAPVTFPIASESAPSRIQMKLLSFSGSSVARGARTRASTIGATPTRSEIVTTSSTKKCAPPTISAIPSSSWTAIRHERGSSRPRSR
jgi:hypothetical protein